MCSIIRVIIGDKKKMLLPEVAKGAIAPKMEFKGKKIEKGVWKKRETEFVPGEILIKLKPGKDRDAAFQEKLFSGDLKKAKLKRKFDRFGVGLIDAGDKIDVLKECERLEKNPEVEYAEPNMIDRDAATIPNDTGYPNQWALPMIDAPNAWDIETGNSNVLIAVLDTGIPMDGTPPSLCHPDLNDPTRIILGHDYVNNDAYPRDDRGHGTHVTGIASAQTNNAIGVAGLCWGSKIYVTKTRDEYGSGSHQDFYDAVIEAVDYAVNNRFRLVINYSAGGGASHTKEQAVIYARDRDCLIVAAAGNDYEGAVGYPAAYSATYDNVIAVSATDSMDHFAAYSNKGPEINVAAPGSHIYSTMPNYHVTLNDPPPVGGSYNQDYDYLNGTSMATPYVSGLAALLLSCDNGLTAAEVRDIIESTSDDLGSPAWDEYYGYGRIDANAALRDACPGVACLREGPYLDPCRYRKELDDCVFACMSIMESFPGCYRRIEPFPSCQRRIEPFPGCYRAETECLREGFSQQCMREGVMQTCTREGVMQTCTREGVMQTCTREGVMQTCTREGVMQTCTREGVMQTCMREGVMQGIPQRFIDEPRHLKSARHIGEFQRLKHIKPLTKRGPLSHKKRYYPGR